MLVLAFDTATAAVTTALCEWIPGGEVRLRAKTHTVDRRHAEYLAPAIEAVLAEGGARPEDLSAVAVGVGPGPYTGLRVGLATAHALGNALRVPVHGVCTLDAIAWASGRKEPFVVATDARRREVYWAQYDDFATRVSGPQVGPPAEAAAPGLPVLGEGVTLYPSILGPLLGSAGSAAPPSMTAAPSGPTQPSPSHATSPSTQAKLADPTSAPTAASPSDSTSGSYGGSVAGERGSSGSTGDGEAEAAMPSAVAIAELTVARLNGGPGLPLLPPTPLYLRRPDAREPGPRKKVSQA